MKKLPYAADAMVLSIRAVVLAVTTSPGHTARSIVS